MYWSRSLTSWGARKFSKERRNAIYEQLGNVTIALKHYDISNFNAFAYLLVFKMFDLMQNALQDTNVFQAYKFLSVKAVLVVFSAFSKP